MILYELYWYFQPEDALGIPSAATGNTGQAFSGLLGQISTYIDEPVARAFRVGTYKPEWLDFLFRGTCTESWHSPFLLRQEVDRKRGMACFSYRFTKDQPVESFIVDGQPTKPLYEKVFTRSYFDQSTLFERTVWLPISDSMEMYINEKNLKIYSNWRQYFEDYISYSVPTLYPKPGPKKPKPILRRFRGKVKKLAKTAFKRLSISFPFGLYFKHAWVVMDRIHNASDSGEVLFKYLRADRKDINLQAGCAWLASMDDFDA
jgi:hypothetical protein